MARVSLQRLLPGLAARPKMWSKAALIARTRCARCEKLGHWVRNCASPPDERGKRRTGMTGFMMTATGVTDGDSVFFWVQYTDSNIFPENLETFTGMIVIPGYGLIDTGTEHGVIGNLRNANFCEILATFGLKPQVLLTFRVSAIGVGGTTQFLSSAEVPVAIQGSSALITVRVVEAALPLLLPIGFCNKLRMILDTNDKTATWKKPDNKVSRVHSLPSDHVSMNVLEFPLEGWQNLHEKDFGIFSRDKELVRRCGFEIEPQSSTSKTIAELCLLQLLCSSSPTTQLQLLISVSILPLRLSSVKKGMLNRAWRLICPSAGQNQPSQSTSSCAAAAARLSSVQRTALWRRLLIKVSVLFQTVAAQTKALFLLGKEVYDKLFQKVVKLPAPTQVKYRFLKGQVLGKALEMGAGRVDEKKAHMDPAMCQHPDTVIMPRANGPKKVWTLPDILFKSTHIKILVQHPKFMYRHLKYKDRHPKYKFEHQFLRVGGPRHIQNGRLATKKHLSWKLCARLWVAFVVRSQQFILCLIMVAQSLPQRLGIAAQQPATRPLFIRL